MSPEENQLPAPAPSAGVPAMSSGLGRGHEEPSDMDELEIPRAKLVQFTSAEAQAEDIAERKNPGSLINSITKEPLDQLFIPIFKFTNFVQWNPRKKDDPNFDPNVDPGGVVFTSIDREDPRVIEGIKFGPNGEPPKITRYMNFLAYFPGHPYPLVLSFAKTSFAAGKRLLSLLQMAKGDMFANKFKLTMNLKEGDAGKYFVLNVLPAGKATEEEFKVAEAWFEDFRGRNLKVHTDDEEKPAPGEDWKE